MAKQHRTLLFIGALGFAFWQFAKRTYNKITYSAGGFRIHKISFSQVEFRMELTVTNQSDVPAPISAFIGQLVYLFPNPTNPSLQPIPGLIGDLIQVKPVDLPGFGSAIVEFSMKSSLTGGAWEILRILTNDNPTNPAAIKYGNLNMSRFFIIGTLKIGSLPISIKTSLV